MSEINPTFEPRPLVLEGTHVRLEPLRLDHAKDLLDAGRDATLWRWLPIAAPRTLADHESWVRPAMAETQAGTSVVFAIIDRKSGRAVGSTRYLDIRRENRGLEIGWTWLGADAQRTAVNTECKFLLLRHAFEDLGAIRVQFKTDARNERSQAAIARIGAIREGVFRQHMICWDGHLRDSVFFSITDVEWPAVRQALTARLERG